MIHIFRIRLNHPLILFSPFFCYTLLNIDKKILQLLSDMIA